MLETKLKDSARDTLMEHLNIFATNLMNEFKTPIKKKYLKTDVPDNIVIS